MKRLTLGFVVGLLFLPIAFAASLGLGAWRIDASADPPAWEGKIARYALDASLSHGTPLSNPVSATAPELLAGLRFYRNGCAGCHGDVNGASAWGSRGFYPRAPQFGEQPPVRSEGQMFRIVKYGIRYSGMGGWEQLASDQQILQTVTFLSRLRSLPPEVEAEWRKPPTR